MKKIEKEQFLKKKKEAERSLENLLRATASDLSLADVLRMIFEEKSVHDFTKLTMIFREKVAAADREEMVKIINDAWNYFPHRALRGLAPAEKIKGYSYAFGKDGGKSSAERTKLTSKQTTLLWGDTGPYSQAKLIREVRILDDGVSREFIIVEVDINPTTFELVKRHRRDAEFRDDEAIQQLLDHASWRGPEFGYAGEAFSVEYTDESVWAAADEVLLRVQYTVIKMHKFVMKKYFPKV
jgi:hypothetical protein